MERLLNVVTVLSAGLLLAVLKSMRGAHIRVEHSVSWLAAALTLLVLSRWEAAWLWLADAIGVGDPALALVFVVGCVFLIVFYRFSRVISELKDANISLAQRVAILEFHLRTLHAEQETGKGA